MIAGLTNRPELTKSPSRGNEEAFRFRVDSCICLCKFRYESARRKSFEVIAAAAEGGLIQRDSARLFCPCIIFSAAACRIQMQKITWCLVPCRPAEPFFRFATSVNFHPRGLLNFNIFEVDFAFVVQSPPNLSVPHYCFLPFARKTLE